MRAAVAPGQSTLGGRPRRREVRDGGRPHTEDEGSNRYLGLAIDAKLYVGYSFSGTARAVRFASRNSRDYSGWLAPLR